MQNAPAPNQRIYSKTSSSVMLNRSLWQQWLSLALHTALERRANQIVEHKGAIHQQCKAQYLQPLECLPAETQGDNPNKERTAGIDGRARCGADSPGNGKTEEVETAVVCQ